MEVKTGIEHDLAAIAPSPDTRPIHLKQLYPLLLLLLGSLAYINSFTTPFIFDGIYDIVENASIRHLWPPWQAMFGPENISRPLIGLSLAINYAISGLNPWSYHVLNLIIHLLAGLTLFGIVRRTLLTGPLAARFGEKAEALAFAVAAVWTVHPIQTAAVTYVIQRCESLMGLFYLLTLYFFIRGATSEKSKYWYAGAIAACALGTWCKQVMVTAPLIVLLYDLVFFSTSPRNALSGRRRLYAGLAMTWIPLAIIVLASPHNATAGFGVAGIGPIKYLASEFRVVCYYIKLSFWPDSLCLDYYWPVANGVWQVVPYGLFLIALGGATVWAFVKRKPVAFLGIWFFVVLSVTSSFMPFTDLAFDHRMYLPIAALVALLIVGGQWVIDKAIEGRLIEEARQRTAKLLSVVALTAVIASLAFATLRRNVLYQYPIAMWEDAISKRPDNPRAYGSLGLQLIEAGRLADAESVLRKALTLKPGYVGAEAYLGRALVLEGRPEEAAPHLLLVLRANPNHPAANLYFGRVLISRGQFPQAIPFLRKAVELEPDYAEAHYFLGLAFSKVGKAAEAREQFAITERLWPGLVEQMNSQPRPDGSKSATGEAR